MPPSWLASRPSLVSPQDLGTSLASLPLWHQLLWGAAMAVVGGEG